MNFIIFVNLRFGEQKIYRIFKINGATVFSSSYDPLYSADALNVKQIFD